MTLQLARIRYRQSNAEQHLFPNLAAATCSKGVMMLYIPSYKIRRRSQSHIIKHFGWRARLDNWRLGAAPPYKLPTCFSRQEFRPQPVSVGNGL